MAWDPKIYLSYGAERTRPAADLLSRVLLETPSRVADLGCGPGNSTALLRARWPEAEIDAIDSSAEMLQAARAAGLDARLIQADIAQWTPGTAYDVIYSNAALQWLGNHETLFPPLVRRRLSPSSGRENHPPLSAGVRRRDGAIDRRSLAFITVS